MIRKLPPRQKSQKSRDDMIAQSYSEAKRGGYLCPQCESGTIILDGAHVKGESWGMIRACARYPVCDSWVMCHRDGRPMGTLAGPKLRYLRRMVHLALDGHWKPKRPLPVEQVRNRRRRAYSFLANSLGVPIYRCHVAAFDEPTCKRALELLRGKLGG